MDRTDCVVYSGQFFTVEWYYDKEGYSQPFEYFLKCDKKQRRKFFMLVHRICDFGRIMDKTKFTNEDDGIYAFKPQPDRYLAFFIKGKKIIITNAFIKKTQKLPQQEKDLALKNKSDYLARQSYVGEEKYNDNI